MWPLDNDQRPPLHSEAVNPLGLPAALSALRIREKRPKRFDYVVKEIPNISVIKSFLTKLLGLPSQPCNLIFSCFHNDTTYSIKIKPRFSSGNRRRGGDRNPLIFTFNGALQDGLLVGHCAVSGEALLQNECA